MIGAIIIHLDQSGDMFILLNLNQIDNGQPPGGAAQLRNLVCFQAVNPPFISKQHDEITAGASDLDEVGERDVVIGLAASGRTPYVAGALAHATERGAVTALVTSNPRSPLRGTVDVEVVVETGPEALTGSTRMKSATAQKLVLHSFSTALMVRLGRTWSNLMVSMVATNQKLRARTVTILHQATGLERAACERLLEAADGDLKVALVMSLADTDTGTARAALDDAGGVVREAVRSLTPPSQTPPSRREP